MAYRDTVTADSPLYYWPMDETSGTTLAALAGSVDLSLGASTAAPTLGVTGQVDGTAVQFDGVNDYAQTASAIDLSASSGIVVECLLYWNAFATNNAMALEFTANGGTTAGGFYFTPNASDGSFQLTYRGNVGQTYGGCDRPPAARWHHVALRMNSAASRLEEVQVYVDGLPAGMLILTASENTGTFANSTLYVMSRAGSTFFGGGRMQHLAIYSNSLTDARIFAHATEAMGLTEAAAGGIAVSPGNVHLWGNGRTSGTPKSHAYAELRIASTDAELLRVASTNTLYPNFASWNRMEVFVDGVAVTRPFHFWANGSREFGLSLPAGTKSLTIRSGVQSSPSGTVLGEFIDSVRLYGRSGTVPAYALSTPSTDGRVVVYGDSIAVGANATNPGLQGWTVLMRDTYSRNVLIEGHGFRSLFDDIGTSAALDTVKSQAFADRLASYSPECVYLAIGTNDYGLNKWTAANFGLAYVDLLDRLHIAAPWARIYCQTPLLRTSEVANASGSTLGNYRTQIATAVASRSWTTLVDGTAIMTTASLADGVHPTTAGHALYAAYVAAAVAKPAMGDTRALAMQTRSLATKLNVSGTLAHSDAADTYKATGFSTLDAAGVRTAVGLASANLDDQFASIEIETGPVTLAADQPNYAPAKAGDAMTLTSGERTTLVGMVWSALTSGMTTAGTIGRLIVDKLAYITAGTAVESYYADRTSSGQLVVKAGATFRTNIVLGEDISNRTNLWFTLKQRDDATQDTDDANAYIQVSEEDGLLKLNKADADDDTLGTITVTDESTGAITIEVEAAATGVLPKVGNCVWDAKYIESDSDIFAPVAGTARIEKAVTLRNA